MAVLRFTQELHGRGLDHLMLTRLLEQDFAPAKAVVTNTFPGPKFRLHGVSVDDMRAAADAYLTGQGLDEGYGYQIFDDDALV